MSITATVENNSVQLPPGVHVPDGTKVEVTLLEPLAITGKPDNAMSWMMKYAGSIDGPKDFAAEHDHYIHGTPKRADG